jgi:hypothetical protein
MTRITSGQVLSDGARWSTELTVYELGTSLITLSPVGHTLVMIALKLPCLLQLTCRCFREV